MKFQKNRGRFLSAVIMVLFISCSQAPQAEAPIDTVIAKPADTPLQSPRQDTPLQTPPQEVKTTDPVLVIREKVTHINTTTLKKKHFEFVCDVNTKVDYFYLDNEIVKISIDFGTLGDVYAREDYYYDNNELIFFYEFTEGGPACEGCIKTNEYRSYIKDGKVFKYLKNKTIGDCRKCTFGPGSRQYKLLKATTEKEVKAIVCKY